MEAEFDLLIRGGVGPIGRPLRSVGANSHSRVNQSQDIVMVLCFESGSRGGKGLFAPRDFAGWR
jgi:hypothetical protein